MKSCRKIVSLLIAMALVLSSLPFSVLAASSSEGGLTFETMATTDSSLVIKRPVASIYVTDVTRVAYAENSMKAPSGSNSVIVKATPSGIPELNGTFTSAAAYAGETPTATQIVFTPGVELPSDPTISCSNTTVTISDYSYSNGTYVWSVTGGTATVGTTLLFTVSYKYTDYNSVTGKNYERSYNSYGVSYVEAIATPAGIYTTKRTYEDFWLGQSTKNRSYVGSYILGANTYGSLYNSGTGDGSINFANTGTELGWTSEFGVMKTFDGHSASRDYNVSYSADTNRPLTYVYFDRSNHSTLSDLNLRLVTTNVAQAGNSNEQVTVSLKNQFVNYGIVSTYSEETDDGSPTNNSYAADEIGLTSYSGSIFGAGATFQQYFTGSGPSEANGTYNYTVTVKYQTAADWSEVFVGHSHSLRIISYDKGTLRTFVEAIQGTDPDTMTTDIAEGGFKGYNPQEWYYASGWESFFNAYKSALACLKQPNVTQTEIDAIYNSLVTAYNGLVMRTADYSVTSAYYNQALAKNQSYYTLASWAKVQNILDAYVSNYSAIYQPAADKVGADLKAALDSLEEATADYTYFNAHLKTINNLMARSLANYGIPASEAYNNWSKLEETLTKTGCVYDELDGYIVADPLLISEQGTVDGYVLLLERSLNALSLKSANYTESAKAKAAYKAVNLSYLVSDCATELTAAYNALVALDGKDLSYQTQIDEATATLNEKLANLQYKPADTTAALQMIATANSIDRSEYEDLSAVDAALATLESKLDLDIRYQSEIDRATAALESAINSLNKNLADYTAVNDAIALVEERENLIKDTYVDSYGFTVETFYSNWSSVIAAIENVDWSLDLTQQSTVDAYATAITTALASLVENTADYTEVKTLYDEAYEVISTGESLYTEASLDNLMSVYTSVVFNKTVSEQATVDGYVASLSEAIENLEYLPADYTQVNIQIALAQENIALNEEYETAHPGYTYYTTETLDNLNMAVASVDTTLDIREQTTVDAYATAIEEAISNLAYAPADYTAVDAKLLEVPEDLSVYTTLSVATLNATIKNIDNTLTADKQATVDRYVTSIGNAITGLKYKAADYSSVTTALKKVPSDSSIYTEESWNHLQEQITAVVYDLDITHQDEVDNYALAIEQAVEFLRYNPADYTEVDEAIAAAEAEIAKGIYTDDSVALVNEAIDAVVRDYPVTQQSDVDAFVTVINTAVGKLVEKDADYTSVDEAIEAAETEIAKGYYSDESVSNLQNAIDAVVRGYKITRQDEVDSFAEAIIDATSKLEIVYADYTDVDDAIACAQEEIATGLYTDESVAVVQAAIDAVDRTYPYTRQDEVDAFASAIDDAVSMLKYKSADYTAVDEAIKLANTEIAKGIYTETSVANLQKAINAVVRGYNILNQTKVDAYATAINNAVLNLKIVGADYTSVTDAITAANEKIATGYYTDDSVALVQDEINAVEYDLGVDRQADVEAYATAIVEATENMVLKSADYTSVTDAITAANEKIATGYYTDDSVALVEEVINTVEYDLTIDKQADVEAYAAAIVKATENMVLKSADYTSVTDAITIANEKIATGYYTDDSVALLQAEIEKVDYTLDITHQAEVRQYADNIVEFTNNLELKLADYTELQKILDLLDNSSSEIYTIVYTNFNEVMSLIADYRENTVSQNMSLTIDNQAQVDEMTATLQGYIDSLVPAATETFELIGGAEVKMVSGVNYIIGLQPSLTKAKFQSTYIYYENVTVSYEMTTARYLGTGSKVIVKSDSGEVIDEYVIIIYGDVDGTATINARDVLAVKNSVEGTASTFTGAEKLAANVEGTRATINAKDAEVLNSVVAGIMTIDQTTGKGVSV